MITGLNRGTAGAGSRRDAGKKVGGFAAVLLATTAIAAPASAQDDDGLYWAQRKNVITVAATRLPSNPEDVPATVTVIDDEQIADELVTDIKDLVRFEPGVTVPRSPARFGAALGTTGRAGNEGFTIRGIGGNRTLILVDGVRVPDGFSFGAQSVGRGDYVDVGLVKQVEILRGPASALYGSDGLSGAVSFTLSDPEDFLQGGAKIGGLVRAGYSSDDNEFAETAILAGGGDKFSVMAAYTRRDFKELDNKGTVDAANSTRTLPNPQNGRSDALLGRIVFKPGGGHKLRLTGEYTDTYMFTDVLSGRSASVLDLKGTDAGSRTRIAGDWSWDGDGTFEHAQLGVYWQQARDRQFTAEDRNPAVDRTRDNTFDNRVYGASAEARASFGSDGFKNRIVLGGDVSFTRQEGIRDGTVPPAGETFPTRAFPVTNFTLGGAFIGDEISFGDGTFTLFPALRFDAYKLDATDDPLLPTFVEADQSGSHVSPKLGAVAKFGGFRVFANYAQGFKAPSPSQVNNFFENPAQGYKSIPNPDLKPETSRSFEGGVRFADETFSFGVTGFHSKYKNFIEQVETTGLPFPNPPTTYWLYQWVNLSGAKISGVEARGDFHLKNGINGRLAVAYADGDQILSGGGKAPLASADPLSIVGGLGYRDPGGKFGGEFVVTHNSRKPLADTAGVCSSTCYRPDSFTILDATAFFKVTDALTIRAGVFNIFDEKYTYWSDVRGLADSSTVKDAYTRPGRNASASVSYRF